VGNIHSEQGVPKRQEKDGIKYSTWKKDGTMLGDLTIAYLATLMKICIGYAHFGIRINQIESY
jgi:hypothetical protein